MNNEWIIFLVKDILSNGWKNVGRAFCRYNNLKYILKINFILLININNLSLYNVVINYYLNYLIFHFYFF